MELLYKTGGVTSPQGFLAAGVHSGIRKNQSKSDLALIYSKVDCTAAAVYTQNKVYGAPITVTKAHLEDGKAQAVICNSGNANTCNRDGVEKANLMCSLTAKELGIEEDGIIVASTGVIGKVFPIEPIAGALPLLVQSLSAEGGGDAASAILTTDTCAKEAAVSFALSGKTVSIGACAKGSGMIHPNMATMLCFITTDAAISPEMLSRALTAATAESFNMISVDGDTSTNDMVSVLANGLAKNPMITEENEDYQLFLTALTAVCIDLSKKVAGDGEGATHLLECVVAGAASASLAKKIAKSVIGSNLVKAAMFGADANWGRVLCAIGYTDEEFPVDKIEVSLSSKAGCLKVCEDGFGIDFSEEKAKKVLSEKEIGILIHLNDGNETATAWGCDLTYDYVKINGDYRS